MDSHELRGLTPRSAGHRRPWREVLEIAGIVALALTLYAALFGAAIAVVATSISGPTP